MTRRWRTFAALVPLAALAMLAGCATGPAAGRGPEPGALPKFHVGGDTVLVAPFHSSARQYTDLEAFVAAAPIVVTGKVVAADDTAYEVLPDPDAEGVLPGEGPDIVGSITFAVTGTVKGPFSQKQIEIVYESGKRETSDRRIAYSHEGLAPFQTASGRVRGADALAGREFVIFARPNTVFPVRAGAYVLAHPLGIASLASGGSVRFNQPGARPFGPAAAGPFSLTLKQVRAAAR
ncbi:hypothetical protein [Actinoplanes sp. NPDC049316]|uniref:hypothetical protein n=1 Tax=Actinoplanes sp. NPDC049316 TaxID=3154727 RepID=UPI00344221B5